jgi:CubicO group peptidase (beta-lactamase class C family)
VTSLEAIGGWLERRLPTLLEETGVPAASIAVGRGDDVVSAAAGVLHRGTGVEATVDSLFQVGSVTKTLTAALVLQLVDEGVLDLDAPVRKVLPDFRVGDEDAAATITPRHLLSHTAGFEGDVFTDTGKGDDCLERYVDLLGDTPQLFSPGAMWSYNNAGFCVLGRIVEVLRGQPYDACLRDDLFVPLGLRHVATDPYEAVLHRTAVGHVPIGEGGALEPTRVWAMARSNAPAGSMVAMSANDLLTFALSHRGRALAVVQEPQVPLPDIAQGAAWGLGWELFTPDATVLGHDGNTIGQSAYLRLVPARDLAVVVLTNGGPSRRVYDDLAGRVLRELGGVVTPHAPAPAPHSAAHPPIVDATRYSGTYASVSSETVVSQDADGTLRLERTPLGELAALEEPVYRTALTHWRGHSFVPVEPEGGVRAPLAFLGDDGSGRAAFLHNGRADRRVG